jgi:hypothetical protein
LGFKEGREKEGELLHVHFCSFFGCLVDGQSFSSFFIAWNHIENYYYYYLFSFFFFSFSFVQFVHKVRCVQVQAFIYF